MSWISIQIMGMAIHHYGEGICSLRMLLAAHPDTRLRHSCEARCDSYLYRIDILERRMARGRTPGLKLLPPTPVAAGTALSSIWIQHRMSVMPRDRRFLP